MPRTARGDQPDRGGAAVSPTDAWVRALGPNAPVIVRSARAHGVNPLVALAVARGEGGYQNPTAVGDHGTSFGPFQLHAGGALPSVYWNNPQAANAWANSPQGIDYAMTRIAAVTRGKSPKAAIAAAVREFERPADPNPEIRKDTSFYNSLVSGHAAALGRVPAGTASDGSDGTGGFPSGQGSSAGVAPKTVANVFDNCHAGTTILGFIPAPSPGGIACYATGMLKVSAMALGGVMVMGVGFYLMLPRFRSQVNTATAGTASKGAALLPAGRAAKAATAAAGAHKASSAAATEQHRSATRRADLRAKRARARTAESQARNAKYNEGGRLRLSPATEDRIARAQRQPARSRPDRVA